LDPVADLFAVAALLALGTVALALAGLDTGTAFGGMGASREVTVMALVEPTMLLSVFALSVRVGSTNLASIVGATVRDPLGVLLGLLATLFAPWGIAAGAGLAAVGLALVAFAAKVAVLGVVLATGEVFLAKLRLFRVPELLAGSFLLALLAVAASFFLG